MLQCRFLAKSAGINMDFIKKYNITLIGTIVGLIGGFLYWNYIGCISGSCPIQSNPIISTLYGGLMGLLFGKTISEVRLG